MRIALVSCTQALPIDEDLPPLAEALSALGGQPACIDWAAGVDLAGYDAAVLRSAWDYAERRDAFLDWARLASQVTRLLNPFDVVRWNTDKHYLTDLAAASVPVVPTTFVEPAATAWALPGADEVVVKPAVGAGSRDAARYGSDEGAAIDRHVARLLAQGRAVMIQPYLRPVDQVGETVLVYFSGVFSHALAKGPLLQRGAGLVQGLFAQETMAPRTASAAERSLAEKALAAAPHPDPLTYARADVVRDDNDEPVLLELELVEPSVFHAHAPGSAARFAEAIIASVGGSETG